MNFFCEYKDREGHQHWAVNKFNAISRMTTTMKDLKVDIVLKQKDLEEVACNYKYSIVEDDGVFNMVNNATNSIIAVFFDQEEAEAYVNLRNESEDWLDDKTEDPWL